MQKWIDYQADKVKRAFDVLEAAPPALDAVPNVGQITLACALGYQRPALRRQVARATIRSW